MIILIKFTNSNHLACIRYTLALIYTIEQATEIFARGFCTLKSRTHPYIPEKVVDLWVCKDGPGRKDLRKIEVLSPNLGAKACVEQIHDLALGWHFVCEISPMDVDLARVKADYKSLGYRAMSTESMMVHDLKEIPEFTSDPAPRLVREKDFKAIKQVASHARMAENGTEKFCIWDESRDYGWVTNVPIGKAAWIGDLYVFDDVRGRGYGKALMSTILGAQKDQGFEQSVLLASSAGMNVYPKLRFTKIGTLQLFCPVKRN